MIVYCSQERDLVGFGGSRDFLHHCAHSQRNEESQFKLNACKYRFFFFFFWLYFKLGRVGEMLDLTQVRAMDSANLGKGLGEKNVLELR